MYKRPTIIAISIKKCVITIPSNVVASALIYTLLESCKLIKPTELSKPKQKQQCATIPQVYTYTRVAACNQYAIEHRPLIRFSYKEARAAATTIHSRTLITRSLRRAKQHKETVSIKLMTPKLLYATFARSAYIYARARARFPSDNYAATQKEAEKKAA